jgi:hypothetical protein
MNFKVFFTALIKDKPPEKNSKADAGYVPVCLNEQYCKDCTMWREPNQCTAVRGLIEREASCNWWRKGDI